MTQTQAIQQTDKIQTLRTVLGKMQKEIQVALPQGMMAARMIRIALTTIQKTPGILDCSARSIVAAVVEASQLGLTVDGVLGHGYIVPYKPRGQAFSIAQFQIGYRGFCFLAWRTAEILINADVVHAHDYFDYEDGATPRLVHKKTLKKDQGELTAVWAVARLKDGQHLQVVMTVPEIEKVRRQAASGNSEFSPWATHWEEMAKKTAIRRLAKTLPISEQLQQAAVSDEYKDAGVLDGETVDLTALDASVGTQLKAEELKEQLAAEKAAQVEKQEPKKKPAKSRKKPQKAKRQAGEPKDKQVTEKTPQKPNAAQQTTKGSIQPGGKVENKVTRKGEPEPIKEEDYPEASDLFGKK